MESQVLAASVFHQVQQSLDCKACLIVHAIQFSDTTSQEMCPDFTDHNNEEMCIIKSVKEDYYTGAEKKAENGKKNERE